MQNVKHEARTRDVARSFSNNCNNAADEKENLTRNNKFQRIFIYFHVHNRSLHTQYISKRFEIIQLFLKNVLLYLSISAAQIVRDSGTPQYDFPNISHLRYFSIQF
jgi:hypothetical protein